MRYGLVRECWSFFAVVVPPWELQHGRLTTTGGAPLSVPKTKVTSVGKTKFTIGVILFGHFWYTDFWVPDPRPFPLF